MIPGHLLILARWNQGVRHVGDDKPREDTIPGIDNELKSACSGTVEPLLSFCCARPSSRRNCNSMQARNECEWFGARLESLATTSACCISTTLSWHLTGETLSNRGPATHAFRWLPVALMQIEAAGISRERRRQNAERRTQNAVSRRRQAQTASSSRIVDCRGRKDSLAPSVSLLSRRQPR